MFVFHSGLLCFCAAPENLPFDASCFIFCLILKFSLLQVFPFAETGIFLCRGCVFCSTAAEIMFLLDHFAKILWTSICTQSSTGYHRFVRLLTPFLNLHIQRRLISKFVPHCRLPSCDSRMDSTILSIFWVVNDDSSSSAAATAARPHHCGHRRWRRNFATFVCRGPASAVAATAAADVGGVTLPPASTAASGGGQGRPGRTRTDGMPRGGTTCQCCANH
jgi:hypothetical protein